MQSRQTLFVRYCPKAAPCKVRLTALCSITRKQKPADSWENCLPVCFEIRTCLHKKYMWIFEHNFVADKKKIRRRAVARQVFFTQYAAKFAEKTRVYACEDRFLQKRADRPQDRLPEQTVPATLAVLKRHTAAFLNGHNAVQLHLLQRTAFHQHRRTLHV